MTSWSPSGLTDAPRWTARPTTPGRALRARTRASVADAGTAAVTVRYTGGAPGGRVSGRDGAACNGRAAPVRHPAGPAPGPDRPPLPGPVEPGGDDPPPVGHLAPAGRAAC